MSVVCSNAVTWVCLEHHDPRPQHCSVLTGSKLCSLFCPCHWWGCAIQVQQKLSGDLGVCARWASSFGAEVRCFNGTRFAKVRKVLWLAVGDVWFRQIPAAFCPLAVCWGSLRNCLPAPHEWLGGSLCWCWTVVFHQKWWEAWCGQHCTDGGTEAWVTLTQA